MTIETPVTPLDTPVAAIKAAIAQFPSQADFRRALMKRADRPVSNAAISQWVLRGTGASPTFAPAIEAISGVPCEALCPEVSWGVLRATVKPPVYVPRGGQ